MVNDPRPSKQKRPDPPERHNAQGDHVGAAHDPEEFVTTDPQKQRRGVEKPPRPTKAPKGNP